MNIEIIYNFDFIILNWIQQFLRCKFLDLFTIILSYVSASGIIWIVLGVVMLFFHKMRSSGVTILLTLIFAFLVSDILLKHLVNRPRPFIINPVILLVKAPSSASFPSTHSCLSAAVSTILFVKNKMLSIIAIMLTFCIAFSRLYLYVHYPTDVFAGLITGILCASVVLWLSNQVGLEKKISQNKNS